MLTICRVLYDFELEYRSGVHSHMQRRSKQSSGRMAAILGAKATKAALSEMEKPVDVIMDESTADEELPLIPTQSPCRKRGFSFSMVPSADGEDTENLPPFAKKQNTNADAIPETIVDQDSISKEHDPVAFAGNTASMANHPEIAKFRTLPAVGYDKGFGTLASSVTAKTRMILQAKGIPGSMPVTDAVVASNLDCRAPEFSELNLNMYHAIQVGYHIRNR